MKTKIKFLGAMLMVSMMPSLANANHDGVERVRCSRLQETLDEVPDGTTIEVRGNCRGNWVVRKNRITLRARRRSATLEARDESISTIRIEGQGVRILNFAELSGGREVIKVRNGGSAVIKRNTIRGGTRAGILVEQRSFADIQENWIGDSSGTGIYVLQGSAVELKNNSVVGNGPSGIYIGHASTADIDGNYIAENNSGIQVRFNSSISFSDDRSSGRSNRIEQNEVWGVVCQSNASIEVNDPVVFGTGSNANGWEDSLLGIDCSVVNYALSPGS